MQRVSFAQVELASDLNGNMVNRGSRATLFCSRSLTLASRASVMLLSSGSFPTKQYSDIVLGMVRHGHRRYCERVRERPVPLVVQNEH